ncbi:hypothetical protein FJ651_00615 [Paucihalobacter ruber]|uniref:Phage holin family protein n=1 Tax=Paucihalobacter ruber TaxID=2567861 RepID=A0A506PNI0_9FLAO|nr:phage holin family protein [Paucihalobacter ruber]TPV35456.1 hypothetical protein FJ651_00615 [Paucihalobacter ruber]
MTDTTKIEALTEDLKAYLQTSKSLLQSQITEKIAVLSASIIQHVITTIVVIFCLLFLSISLGIYLSILFDSYLFGFLSVSGVYMIILVLLLLINKQLIRNPIINRIIFKITNNQ